MYQGEDYMAMRGKEIERAVLGTVGFSELDKFHSEAAAQLIKVLNANAEKLNVPFIEPDNEGRNINVSLIERLATDTALFKKVKSETDAALKAVKKRLNDLDEMRRSEVRLSADALTEYARLKADRIFLSEKQGVYTGCEQLLRQNFLLDKMISQMEKLQRGNPVRTAFSVNLLDMLSKTLQRKGVKVNRLEYFTTITDNDRFVTWPDAAGIDAFLSCEVVDNDKTNSMRVYMDGSKNPEKCRDGIRGPGTKEAKLIVPFDKISTEQDIMKLGRDVGHYIISKQIIAR